MKQPYEILIRFDEAGKFKAAHFIERDDVTGIESLPRAVQPSDWPEIVGKIDAAAVLKASQAEESIAAITTHRDEVLAKAKEAAAKGDVTVLAEVIAASDLSDKERERQRLLDEKSKAIADYDARIEALDKPEAAVGEVAAANAKDE